MSQSQSGRWVESPALEIRQATGKKKEEKDNVMIRGREQQADFDDADVIACCGPKTPTGLTTAHAGI